MTTWRNTYALQCEEISELIRPNSRNTFFYGSINWPGTKKTQSQIDATGMMALSRFGAICDSMLTPRNMQWHELKADSDYVMKDRLTRLYFDEVTRILFKYRYAPLANFTSQNQNNYQELGAFGNGGMFIDALDSRLAHGARGIRYKSLPFGEIFWRENHQGMVDGFVRWMKLTAAQAAQKWGKENLPANLISPLQSHSQWLYTFLHCVRPRDDYDPGRYDARRMPFGSYYVSVDGQCLMAPEGGYRCLPLAPMRYEMAPGEVYARGPAAMVLPSLKTLNAQKTTFLKQGHRAADPVLLTTDDGLTNFNLRPGALNPGGMNMDGKALVGVLPTGNIQTNEKMMDMEKELIRDAFLESLFRLILDEKVLTATQVTEIVNQKGILIGPTLGRQQSEYLGPMIDRELDVLADQGLLPPMPPRLQEARGEYRTVYTSPLARTQRAGQASGFMRAVETSKEVVAITQDPSHLDWADFDTAMPEIADIQGAPVRWTASPEAIAQKRKSRAQAMEKEQQLKALPNIAAMKKADAAQFKAGMTGGQQQGQQQPSPAGQVQ